MKTNKEFRLLIKNGAARVLTIEDARRLKGKEIEYYYFGYNGQNGHGVVRIGEVVSYYDWYGEKACEENDKYADIAGYWESCLTPRRIEEIKNTLVLLNDKGENTFIYCYKDMDGDWFSCSDAGRFVHYIEVGKDYSENDSAPKVTKEMRESVESLKKLFPGSYTESYGVYGHFTDEFYDHCDLYSKDKDWKKFYTIMRNGVIYPSYGNAFVIRNGCIVNQRNVL
jgi:hypothetical protein